MTPMTKNLRREALEIRKLFLKMHYKAKAGHIGTGLSSIDLLTYLYGEWLRPQDRFVLSKGHGASALYATLYRFGRLSEQEFKTYYKENTLLSAHPSPRAFKEIPFATGSLGHGLPVTCGLAYTKRRFLKTEDRFACLLSDGECNEGAVWEAALFAAHHGLSNLVAVIDANGLQGFGECREILNLEPLAAKWHSFGFEVCEIDGHCFEAIHSAFNEGYARAVQKSAPLCVIARTVKGKGISFAENRMEWHYLPMDAKQYARALKDLEAIEGELHAE